MQQRIDKISSKKYQTNIHLLFLVVSCLFEGTTMKKVRYLIGMKSELSVRFSRLKQLISFRLLINLNSEMCEFDKLDKTFTSDLYLILMNCTLRHGDHCWWNLNKRISLTTLFVTPTWLPNLCLLNLKGFVASDQYKLEQRARFCTFDNVGCSAYLIYYLKSILLLVFVQNKALRTYKPLASKLLFSISCFVCLECICVDYPNVK